MRFFLEVNILTQMKALMKDLRWRKLVSLIMKS